LGPWR